MAHVYEACVAKPEEGCLHWAIFTHAQTPSLLSAARILDEPLLVAKASEELMQHLREACARNQGNTSTAYNSWHDEAEKARILATMPPTKQDPVGGTLVARAPLVSPFHPTTSIVGAPMIPAILLGWLGEKEEQPRCRPVWVVVG
jgi:hypothetical protein